MRIQRGAFKAHVKTHGAADAALGLVFHAFGASKPVFGVVIGINKRHAVLLGKADVFVFADFVFFERMDVGVVKINGVVNAAGKQGFHHFARAGGAARMQQEFVCAVGQHQLGAVYGGYARGVHG